jgi:N utilization substance protein A
MEMSGLTQAEVDAIIEYADVESLRIEKEEIAAAAARKLNPQGTTAPVRQLKAAKAEAPEVEAVSPDEDDEPAKEEGASPDGAPTASASVNIEGDASIDTAEEESEPGAEKQDDSEA